MEKKPKNIRFIVANIIMAEFFIVIALANSFIETEKNDRKNIVKSNKESEFIALKKNNLSYDLRTISADSSFKNIQDLDNLIKSYSKNNVKNANFLNEYKKR